MQRFTASELRVLAQYMTNTDRPVFALRNLPEEVKGALFSRYSRTTKDLRRVLLDEFLDGPADVQLPTESSLPSAAAARARDFYDRVLVGFGDDSVAELAGAHVAVEDVSMLAAKAIEDARIGISPLEKSTRYVRFDTRGPTGAYGYYRGAELSSATYVNLMDGLFDAYSKLLEPVTSAVRQRFPIGVNESDSAWRSATRSKALDLLRGLLPAGTLTNLGLYGNGRSFEYLITKLSVSDLPECSRLAREIHQELSVVIPSFVRRALDERYGEPSRAFLLRMRDTFRRAASHQTAASEYRVRMIDYDQQGVEHVLAASLFPYSGTPWQVVPRRRALSALRDIMASRENRRQKPPRSFELAWYTFEVVANFGAYRDLHRHRMLTQDRQTLGVSLGYDITPELVDYGFEPQVRGALERAADLQVRLAEELGSSLAQYGVPLAHRVRWYMHLNLREIFYLCELRTSPQAHPDYRSIAQQIFQLVEGVHPELTQLKHFVNLESRPHLERLTSEMRTEEKRRRVKPNSGADGG